MWLRSKDEFMHQTGMHHLYIGLAYIPPKGSAFELNSNASPAYDILQQDVADLLARDGLAILAGDFNARTGSAAGGCQDDFSDMLDASCQPQLGADQPLPSRKSADAKTCPFGKCLLQLCEASDLHILNGHTTGDADGHFTCHTAQGSSVVDYFLASLPLLTSAVSMTVGGKCVESDHCPLTLKMTLQAPSRIESPSTTQSSITSDSVNIEKIRYDASKIDRYRITLQHLLDPVFDAPSPQCCLASALQSCIAQAALLSFGRPREKRLHAVNQEWYDEECKIARAALRNTVNEMHENVAMLKSYKQLLRRKRRAWQRKAQRDLCELASRNPSSFWRRYNERQSHKCNISREQWKNSFEALYKAPEAPPVAPMASPSCTPVNPLLSPNPTPIPAHSDYHAPPAFDFLNADITEEEVEAALKRLKRNKAAGVDGIRAEHILDASELLMNPLVQTFNQVLNQGVPPAWCTGLIHPIFKTGDPDDAANYRGITVVVILAKLYAMVLEARASGWAEHEKCRAKGQAGFRKDFRTSDQVFIIQTLMSQAKQAKRKLYCCFVDFKKAFDLVPRQTLWSILEQRGMKGKVLSSLQTMYAADKACVLTRDGPTDLFDCSIGVKQGCPASPLLFGLYLDELETLLESCPEIDAPRIAELVLAILLFADDIALFSYSVPGLQKQLDILAAFCAARGLTVNVKKTKTLVFEHRKSATPAFLYAGEPVEQVDEFKYLGILMHGTRGLSPAIEFLCKAARRAMFGVYRRCQQLSIHDPVLKCKLFDALVKPILCYCCEIWYVLGSQAALDDMERVEIGFLKVLLGVPVQTKTLHVLSEFGRYPMHLTWQSQAAKYLNRLESMSQDRILKQAFIADCRLPDKVSWRAKLGEKLHDFLVSTPSDVDHLCHTFSLQSARSAHTAQIQTDVSSRTSTYRLIKEGYACEPYISQSHNKHLRRILAQFRTGSHWLAIETGRHSNIPRLERSCPACSQKCVNPGLPADQFDSFDSDEESTDPVEDEHHVIFDCPSYTYARQLFPDIFGSNIVTVSQFLNQPDCNRLARFLTWVRQMRMNLA